MALEIQQQKRNTAYKIWIGDLLKSNISLNEKRLNYAELGNKRIVRVNITANVIDKYRHNEKPYTSLTIDDSSGQMRVKSFDDEANTSSFSVGDSVRVIGTVRYFNEELYIQPEIIKKVDEKWLLVRKLELGEPMKEPSENSIIARDAEVIPERKDSFLSDSGKESEKIKISEEKIEEKDFENPSQERFGKSFSKTEETYLGDHSAKEVSIKDVLFSRINDNPEGIDIDNLIMSISYPVSDINSNVTELIEEGRIYEPQPGRLRSI